MDNDTVELKDLEGPHNLNGVDLNQESILQYGNHFENCQVINFVLDDKTYTAVEDPDDGYRSSMRYIKVSDYKVKNIFKTVKIIGRMREYDSEHYDILDLIDAKTNKVVLSVGTGNTDDYYPYFVAEFTPENMCVNLE